MIFNGHSHIREARRGEARRSEAIRAVDESARECKRVDIGQASQGEARRGGAARHRLAACAIRS